MPVNFQSDRTILNTNLAASTLYEILRKDVFSDIETRPRLPAPDFLVCDDLCPEPIVSGVTSECTSPFSEVAQEEKKKIACSALMSTSNPLESVFVVECWGSWRKESCRLGLAICVESDVFFH